MKQLIPCLCEMKSIACAAVLCVLPAAAFSQQMIPVMPSMFNTDISKYEVLDTAEYEVSYSLKCVEDPSLKVMKTPVPDVCVLQIGKHISKTYSETVYANDSLDAAQLKAGAGVLSSLKAPVPPVEVFKGYPSGRMTTTYLPIIGGALPAFRYAEPVPQQDWKIGAATKKILGYDCTEATCSYRGRDYVAWFTTAIPLKDGPWMFGGLPGLILAIHDTQNQYVFRCIGISQKPEPIKMF
ncbi:MAG: GLPGLI family protein, partial [Tannerella sp.]|nr:GLPGLI family protein [Tannerella sp.]